MWWILFLCLASAEHVNEKWRCPNISGVSCSCDLPHTLRCTGGKNALTTISTVLRGLSPAAAISLLDCSVQNVSVLPGLLFQGVALQGLVVSSGEIKQVSPEAFLGFATPLQALGLSNNQLESVPTQALSSLHTLVRLDLSHNRLFRIENTSFEGLANLTFLDLSENIISWISADAFMPVPMLHTLRLQGNRISVSSVSKLRGLRNLKELDLSSNSLAGPLGPSTLPRLPNLGLLSLAHNQLSSVTRGALAGLDTLDSLSLNHNQIDVLEDHAFRAIPTLTQLDLAHNRIVAVSGASLAHLTRLKKLDVAHNFLRALTSDLTLPLRNLTELRLDDNDISMVGSDALSSNVHLTRFTLSENPLNCDCSLTPFASWLQNTSKISSSDKATAVCATPPSLENGLVQELSAAELVCGGQEEQLMPENPLATPMPVSGTRVVLRGFQYDGVKVNLLWTVEASALTYSCDALFVYEELGAHEVLLESNPLKCDSTQLVDPRTLSLVLSATDLQPGHRYRYCVVLLEGGASDESALVLGCSEVIPLLPTSKSRVQPISGSSTRTQIVSLDANLTEMGTMWISAQLWSATDTHCMLTVTIFTSGTLIAQRHLNCSVPWAVVHGLPPGPYQVCATLGDFPPTEPKTRCLTITQTFKPSSNTLNFILSTILFFLSTLLILVIYHAVRRVLKRPKNIRNHQFFLPVAQTEDQHASQAKENTRVDGFCH